MICGSCNCRCRGRQGRPTWPGQAHSSSRRISCTGSHHRKLPVTSTLAFQGKQLRFKAEQQQGQIVCSNFQRFAPPGAGSCCKRCACRWSSVDTDGTSCPLLCHRPADQPHHSHRQIGPCKHRGEPVSRVTLTHSVKHGRQTLTRAPRRTPRMQPAPVCRPPWWDLRSMKGEARHKQLAEDRDRH